MKGLARTACTPTSEARNAHMLGKKNSPGAFYVLATHLEKIKKDVKTITTQINKKINTGKTIFSDTARYRAALFYIFSLFYFATLCVVCRDKE